MVIDSENITLFIHDLRFQDVGARKIAEDGLYGLFQLFRIISHQDRLQRFLQKACIQAHLAIEVADHFRFQFTDKISPDQLQGYQQEENEQHWYLEVNGVNQTYLFVHI